MSGRINGSHLKSKHNLTLQEYLVRFPDADIGKYQCYDFTCKICDLVIKGNSETVRRHLAEHGLSGRDEYNLEYQKKFCKCGCGDLSEYSVTKHSYLDFKSGHYHGWNLGLTKENDSRMSKTWSRKFLWTQVDNEKNREIRNRVTQKTIENYATGKIDINKRTESYKKTMLNRYGVDNYFATKEFQSRMKLRCLELYGVEHQMQHPEFFERNRSFRIAYKSVFGPSGKMFRVQGFEDLALEILLIKFNEEDIIDTKSKIPKFMYEVDGKTKRYYPDFYIISENKIIEVKSWFTYEKESNIELKNKSVTDLGYDLEIWIFNNRKNKELTIINVN